MSNSAAVAERLFWVCAFLFLRGAGSIAVTEQRLLSVWDVFSVTTPFTPLKHAFSDRTISPAPSHSLPLSGHLGPGNTACSGSALGQLGLE